MLHLIFEFRYGILLHKYIFRIPARHDDLHFVDLLVSWEVEFVVVFESSCLARLSVTQSKSESVERDSAELDPFDRCDV